MVIYGKSLKEFIEDVDKEDFTERLVDSYTKYVGHKPGFSEMESWTNSLRLYMGSVLRRAHLPDSCGVLLEYQIPESGGKRADMILTGRDENGDLNFIIIELKQWEETKIGSENFTIMTYVGGRNRDVLHPCEQVISYKNHMFNYLPDLLDKNNHGYACAYLHNYRKHEPEVLFQPQFQKHISNNDDSNGAKLFLKDDQYEFEKYLQKHLKNGMGKVVCNALTSNNIRPTKKLRDCYVSILEGNKDFILLDEQIIAFNTIIKYVDGLKGRHTIIIKGGPGTGKSVIGANVLGYLLKNHATNNVRYVAPGAAFKNGIVNWINADSDKKKELRSLFSSSGSFTPSISSDKKYDALIVDEAHRLLQKKDAAANYYGDDQVDDIIRSSKTNVFFIDENQWIRSCELESISKIRDVAKKYKSVLHEIELNTEFRCAGGNEYLEWIEKILQYTAPDKKDLKSWNKDSFDFKVVDTPQELKSIIEKYQDQQFSARIVAGWSWKWTSDKNGNPNGEIDDVIIPEHNFSMPWDGHKNSTKWLESKIGNKQVGTIYNVQGLELDYVGVIIGNDLRFDRKTGKLYGDYKELKDNKAKQNLGYDAEKITEIIKNAYRVLFTRPTKGCYVFCRDPNLRDYIKEELKRLS